MAKGETSLSLSLSNIRSLWTAATMSKGEANDDGDSNQTRHLPPEIVADILSRLPVKSLCQFKCVSPSWNSLISSPCFAQTHLNRTNNTNNNSSQKSILFSGSHSPYSVDFTDANPTAKKLDFPASVNKRIHVSGSCNGLLLVSDKGDKSNFILNPSTRDCKKLPAFSLGSVSGSCFHLRGFGYDSAMDDYKVVMLSYHPDSNPEVDANIITNVAVYSLKTDAWRRIQDSHYVPLGFTSGINFNERLHWLCCKTGGFDYGSNVIVAFDLSDEIFREVQLPASFGNYEIVYHQMAVLGGCLSLVVQSHRYRNEVWMMKEYGVRESWVKFTITIDTGFASQVWMILAKDEYLLRTNGNTIKGEYMEKLVVYNPVKETLRNMVVRGIPTIFRDGGTYVESLVSPNHIGGIGRQ